MRLTSICAARGTLVRFLSASVRSPCARRNLDHTSVPHCLPNAWRHLCPVRTHYLFRGTGRGAEDACAERPQDVGIRSH
jgi:hypothetical protein